jgi:hypothetical protein
MENFGENFTTDQINYDENKNITDYIKNIWLTKFLKCNIFFLHNKNVGGIYGK